MELEELPKEIPMASLSAFSAGAPLEPSLMSASSGGGRGKRIGGIEEGEEERLKAANEKKFFWFV